MGILRFLSVRLVEIIVVVLLVVFLPNVPPNVNFTPFKVSPAQKLEGKLALNNRLDAAERIYENELKGPEAFAEYKGELYVSLKTGEIAKLSKGHIVPIVQFGKPCIEHIEESKCGRPLGIQFDKNGYLYANDAYMGIWKVDVKSGKKTLLVSMDVEIEGKKPRIPNSLILSENGDIYWTDSSSDFSLEDGIYTLFADGSGRLIHYDAKTKTNKVLMDGLHFANGVELSEGEEFVVVAETGRNRLYRFWLKGPKKGTHDVFADGLPGLPDNLRSDGQGGFWVPLIIAVDANNPSINQILGPFPLIRKFFARVTALIELGFSSVEKIYPNIYTKTAVHWLGHFESIGGLVPDRTTILRLSKTGEIIESLHTVKKTISSICDVYVFDDYLYLGSPFNPYLARITLEKAGLTNLKRTKRETPSVKETPRPTTTTPRPTTTTTTTTTAKPTTTTPKPTPAPTTTPKPTQAPTTTPRPTQAPTTTPKPTQAPTTTPKPTPAPTTTQKSAPTPKPTEVPVNKQQKQQQQTTTATKQVPNKQQQQEQPKPTKKPVVEQEKVAPKTVPVKENAMPKSESINPKA